MADIGHATMAGLDLHEAFHYVQTTDPGAVGAGLYWLNTAGAQYLLNRRDVTNTFWISLANSSGEVTGTDFSASGLTGAVHPTRFAGATTGGAPNSGTWLTGDLVTDYNAKVWICMGGGTPGTWQQAGAAGTLDIVMGGSGVTIANGVKGDLRIDTDLQIVGWRLYADVAGTITVDLWKGTHASFPPTVANSIVSGGTLPNLSATDHSQFADLTGWTTLIGAGSVLRLNASGVATVTRVTLALQVLRA